MTNPTQIEAVARAWRVVREQFDDHFCQYADGRDYPEIADLEAAICKLSLEGEALSTKSIPAGWQLVPIKPNFEMQRAGERTSWHDRTSIADIWSAMLAAAPSKDN